MKQALENQTPSRCGPQPWAHLNQGGEAQRHARDPVAGTSERRRAARVEVKRGIGARPSRRPGRWPGQAAPCPCPVRRWILRCSSSTAGRHRVRQRWRPGGTCCARWASHIPFGMTMNLPPFPRRPGRQPAASSRFVAVARALARRRALRCQAGRGRRCGDRRGGAAPARLRPAVDHRRRIPPRWVVLGRL